MPFLMLGDKYARAVKVGAQAQPVMFPLADVDAIGELLHLVDGVMLTGSPSNVHPSHFNESVADPSLPLDPVRDELTLALVKACVREGVPLLGVCRGFQEINVAMGGSLHQRVQDVPGLMDHREPKTAPFEEQYAPRHAIKPVPGSALHGWAGGADEVQVNSLHGQGINQLALPGCRPWPMRPMACGGFCGDGCACLCLRRAISSRMALLGGTLLRRDLRGVWPRLAARATACACRRPISNAALPAPEARTGLPAVHRVTQPLRFRPRSFLPDTTPTKRKNCL
ncbi:MAG: gamma-glutamyl-gamma-aminobutyrate hydrolase family protein [Burkholderiaceae bacterium]